MSTSESDGYESADEKLNSHKPHQTKAPLPPVNQKRYTSIGSDSDDDVEFIPSVAYHNQQNQCKAASKKRNNKLVNFTMESEVIIADGEKVIKDNISTDKDDDFNKDLNNKLTLKDPKTPHKNDEEAHSSSIKSTSKVKDAKKQERPQKQKKMKEIQSLGAKKLGATKIDKISDVKTMNPNEIRKKLAVEVESIGLNLKEESRDADREKPGTDEPADMPAELMSNLKFKDVFKPDAWENLENNVELSDDIDGNKYKPVLNELVNTTGQDTSGWGGWGSWGVGSLLNTATAGVSTLTSHVSQGLSLLEETMGIPNPEDLVKDKCPEEKAKSEDSQLYGKIEENLEKKSTDTTNEEFVESPIQYLPTSFGFGNFMSGVSSLTKLVETTGTKVIAGGLGTLEVIGKKTMEVLQEGDPGLKKKRALFLNDPNKPILSKVLREAKDKAEIEEKMLEEKNLAKRIHFESLFDDYQGLVHLEALEMLSKQCKMKIQTHLDNLEEDDLAYLQGVLEEIIELCDLDNDDVNDNENKNKNLETKLQSACKDLGIEIDYMKLVELWNEMNMELMAQELPNKEVFEKALSGLARFTAYSVERFHKTAELLLIKKRRSTVNESDSLVQLTSILSSQIIQISNLYSSKINRNKVETPKFDVHLGLTTITKEANNAYSYIQEAFMLLIPVVQLGVL